MGQNMGQNKCRAMYRVFTVMINSLLVRRLSRVWLAACLIVGTSQVHGHIIPPEQLHPVAEAYRRANFVLNLNPVVWSQVRADVAQIGEYWRPIDPEAAKTFQARSDRIIAAASIEPGASEGSEPLPRKEAAAQVFQLMTDAVVTLAGHHIGAARRDLENRQVAMDQLRRAQGVWAAFEPPVRATDPDGYRRLGQAWLAMSSAVGNAGLLNYGAVAADRNSFGRHADEILNYTKTNYAGGLEWLAGRRLAAWPVKSPTFNPRAKLPMKLPPGHDINKQIPRPRQILNMVARGVDESETALIALGDMAFDSAYIFGEPMQSLGLSCNNCHNKSITNPNLFVPGLSARPGTFDVSNSFFAPHANNGVFDPLDVPDLRGIRFTAPYGRNGRIASLREFVRNVIVNEFNGPEPDPVVMDGIIAYMNEFDFLTNPALKKDGTLNEKAPASARRGEKIFHRRFVQMSGNSCATCHVPSSHFLDRKSHDIGTVHGYEPGSRDRAMDTPTLLGIKYTAPYFHDGSQPTLPAVVEWFNRTYKLNLRRQELDDLTAYVDIVGDGAEAYEDTVYYLDAEMEEFSFFLSAFEFLDAKKKPELIKTTFQTIALEIRNHKWELRDWDAMPVMERLAQIMDEAYEANDRETVLAKVRQYRELYAENVDILK